MQALLFAIASASAALVATTGTAAAAPATQACLGGADRFLRCPTGAARSGTECRARGGGHWSGSTRQGPSMFLRNDDERDPAKQRVSFAANYVDHKKTGRVYTFDDDGALAGWSDVRADEYHGITVSCQPDGKVRHLAWHRDGKVVGVSRLWNADGSLSYAFQYDANGRPTQIPVTPELAQRPDALCQPAVCAVDVPPDVSGFPR